MHEKATVTGLLCTIFSLGLIRKAATTDKCNGPRQIPIQGKMLKGHIYETRWVRSGYAECLFICREEKVCQSFNFVVKESMCEFNNRTKEACSPEDFVPDPHRLYVKLDVSRGKELWNCFKRFPTACWAFITSKQLCFTFRIYITKKIAVLSQFCAEVITYCL